MAARTLSAFRTLIERSQPTYAAITADYGLESPCDLRDDPCSLAFRDFCLSREYFKDAFLIHVQLRFPHGIHEELHGGQLTLSTAVFRRVEEVPVDDDGSCDTASVEVVKAIAKSVK